MGLEFTVQDYLNCSYYRTLPFVFTNVSGKDVLICDIQPMDICKTVAYDFDSKAHFLARETKLYAAYEETMIEY